ncbi:MAG TPA: PP2C family protein-serine/threonine phosphatase, partial [Ignavibacteriaceae bacterium]|nr:PP2C family protein-serine/threonine phosphatase [Ignavibacteriaceae bacterium]
YGIIDHKKNEFVFARAGHEAAIFFNSESDEIQSLRPTGLGLGLEDGTLFANKIEEHKIKLKPGDTIMFYTDGVTDANNRLNEEYGLNRLCEFIKENRKNDSIALLENIHQDVKNFSQGVNQFDDITGIIVKKL